MPLGKIAVAEFLQRKAGHVVGKVETDAKIRTFSRTYKFENAGENLLAVQRADGFGERVLVPQEISLDEELVAFFGLYSGDGSKGSEDPDNIGSIEATISFFQKEPNLILFALDQFRRIFPMDISFTFSLGEDSAYFMEGRGREMLEDHYGGKIPTLRSLPEIRPEPNDADRRYLEETRDVPGTNEENLVFYYQHREAMEEILTVVKLQQLHAAGVLLTPDDRVTASLRRPYKKGAREPGGSSRADEVHIRGVGGFGELFLKMLYEIESSIYHDQEVSPEGLVVWVDRPSKLGENVDLRE